MRTRLQHQTMQLITRVQLLAITSLHLPSQLSMARQTHVNMMMGNTCCICFTLCCTMFYSEPCLQHIFRISHKPVIKYIKKITSLDGGGGHYLVQMEWLPVRSSVCVPLLIFPCAIKSRTSLLAPAHLGRPGKRAVKRLWW